MSNSLGPSGRYALPHNITKKLVVCTFTSVRIKCQESNIPREMSTSPKSRLLYKYKDLMITFKDDNGRAENAEKALKDPNLEKMRWGFVWDRSSAQQNDFWQNYLQMLRIHV